jgi:hypothetical protein
MSTQQNKNGNGSIEKPTNGKVNTTLNVVPPKPEEEKKEGLPAPSVIGKDLPELPPVEDRILKVNQLFSLVEKHEALLETKKKLSTFKLSTDGNRDTLRILDSKGNDFQTSNTAVIADVMEVLKKSIDAKIAEVENQIRF